MNFFRWVLFACFSLSTSIAFALFEVRVHYGLATPKQSISELCGSCANPTASPDIPVNYGIGADALIKVPLFTHGFGLGIRYENLGFTANTDTISSKASMTRTAVLINYRLIDTLVFLGPIASFGLSHSGNFSITESGTKIADFTGGSISSYSVGIEAGVKLIAFNIGAEVGYIDEKWKGATSQLGSGSTNDINLSGNYGKIHLGFSF